MSFIFAGGAPLAEESFDLLETRCPRLQKIHVESIPESIRPRRVLRFLQNCKHLRSIGLHREADALENDQIHAHLAGRDDIVELKPSVFIEYEKIKGVFDLQSPFKGIRTLHLRLPSKAVTVLVGAIQSTIGTLSLEFQDNEARVLSTIGTLVNLRELAVSFMRSTDLPGTDVLALRHLKKLQSLLIGPQNGASLTSFTLTDDELGQLCAGIEGLKHLWFDASSRLSI